MPIASFFTMLLRRVSQLGVHLTVASLDYASVPRPVASQNLQGSAGYLRYISSDHARQGPLDPESRWQSLEGWRKPPEAQAQGWTRRRGSQGAVNTSF